jgi:hypothetical protein
LVANASVDIRLKINFPVILFTVLLAHVLIFFEAFPSMPKLSNLQDKTTLKIRRVKTPKVESQKLVTDQGILKAAGARAKSPVSLKDLSLNALNPLSKIAGEMSTPQQRPGARPQITAKSLKAMNRMSLKGQEFKDYSKSFPSGGLALSDMISQTQKISDAVVSIEVPDGIHPDELNEYELKFYSFQKRTAINYINSILKNLNKFQKKYPHYKIPSAGRITMTARVTYDPEGNVQQIKMIRWTHINEVQGLFEDIVKEIDQLHNPPRDLWEKQGEFSMFYTLEILNG